MDFESIKKEISKLNEKISMLEQIITLQKKVENLEGKVDQLEEKITSIETNPWKTIPYFSEKEVIYKDYDFRFMPYKTTYTQMLSL